MSSILGVLADKILDIVFKRSRDAEKQQDIELKQQDIEIKKVNEYKQVVVIVVCVALFMCMLASLFPQLAITSWWFEKADIAIEYIFSS